MMLAKIIYLFSQKQASVVNIFYLLRIQLLLLGSLRGDIRLITV